MLRLYRLLLRLFPPSFRRRFGDDMTALFSDRLREARGAGVVAVFLLWLRAVADVVLHGLGERRAAPRRRPTSRGVEFRQSLSLALADAVHAIRLLVRSPAFTGAAVMSLAVGVAGVTSAAAVGDALLSEAIPGVREPSRVVQIARTTTGRGWGTLSPLVVDRLNTGSQQLDSIAALADPRPFSLADGTSALRVWAWFASANLFDVLGVTPALGRLFRPEDGAGDARPFVVLSHRFWREHLASDRNVLDRPFRLNGIPCVVVGVASPDFDGLTFVGGDLWVTTAAAPALVGAGGDADLLTDPANTWLRAVGRLARGATRASARAELNTALTAIRADMPSIPDSHGITVQSLGRTPVPARASFASFVGLLLALTGGLFAIVCSNVGGLLIAKASMRRREVATRLALGARRSRIVSQMLIETLVLFLAAGICAVPVTVLFLHLASGLLPTLPGPLAVQLVVDARAMAVAIGVSLGAGLVFGLLPARHALRPDLAGMLHGHSVTTSRDRLRVRHALLAGQVAVSIALVMTAGLFARSLHAASQVDVGFDTADVDVVTLDTTLAGPEGTDPRTLIGEVAGRVRALDGVTDLGYAFRIPLVSGTYSLGDIRLREGGDGESAVRQANWDVISPGYLRTIRLSLLRGRDFASSDRDGSPDVAIVNETFARRAWPLQEAALGRYFFRSGGRAGANRPYQVIGIVRDSPYQSIGEPPRPVVYVPFAQHPHTHVELFVRHVPGRSPAAAIRRVIHEARPGLPVVAIRSFEDAAALGLFPRQAAASIAGGGAALGIYLTGIGLYGLVAFVVAQRTREFALRLALGASPAQIRSLVLRHTLRLAAVGGITGFALAALLGSAIRARGFVDVRVVDPLSVGGAAVLVGGVLLTSTLLAARRATSLDPARSLRGE
jgi:predicted permease